MARDGVANVVARLRECGFDPRRIGRDLWESRCPAHGSVDHALSITRAEHNHVELKCRSTEACQHFRIVGALGITNDHVYEETPDSLISRLSCVPIQPASFSSLRRGGITSWTYPRPEKAAPLSRRTLRHRAARRRRRASGR
jgi:hypothetical protein